MKYLRILAIYGFVSGMLFLSGCVTLTETPSAADLLLQQAAQTDASCQACAQAALAAALTQEKNYGDIQAAATAEILRANAQATLNSANATLSAAQTQDQNNASIVAAQIAATFGLSDRVCAWQTASVLKLKGEHSSDEFIGTWSGQVRRIIH